MEDPGMRKLLQATLVLCFVTNLWGFSSATQEVQGPKMVLKEQTFDAGQVLEGALIQHTFQVLNEGNQTLLIKDVRPG
jgi:hypothetical protein